VLNAIAIVILAGMMFIPIINLIVGIIAGAALFGVAGSFAGAALAVLTTLATFNRATGSPVARGQLVAAMEHVIFLRAGTRKRPGIR
jgi:hypothetical protein